MSDLPAPYNTDYPADNIDLNLADLDTLFTCTTSPNVVTVNGTLEMGINTINGNKINCNSIIGVTGNIGNMGSSIEMIANNGATIITPSIFQLDKNNLQSNVQSLYPFKPPYTDCILKCRLPDVSILQNNDIIYIGFKNDLQTYATLEKDILSTTGMTIKYYIGGGSPIASRSFLPNDTLSIEILGSDVCFCNNMSDGVDNLYTGTILVFASAYLGFGFISETTTYDVQILIKNISFTYTGIYNPGFGPYLEKSGGTMSGVINMGSHKIITVTDPTDLQDAATKNYVDTSVAQSNTNGMNFKWHISNGAVLNSPTSVTCNQALHQFISSQYTYPLYNNKWQMSFTFPSLTGLPPSDPVDIHEPPTTGNFMLIGTQYVNFYLFNNSNAGNVAYFRLSTFNNLPIDQPFTVGDFVCILFDGVDSALITINGTLIGRYISNIPFYNAGNSILDGPVAGYFVGSTNVNTTVDNITWTMSGVYDTRQSYTQGLDFTWVVGQNVLLNTSTSITCKNVASGSGTSLENFPLFKNKYTLSCKLPDVSTLPSMVLLTPDYANAFYIGGSIYGWIVLFNVSGVNYFSIQYNLTDPLDPHPYTYGHMISIMFNGINSFSVNYNGVIYTTTVPNFDSSSYETIRIGFRLGTSYIPITCTSISWSLNGIYDETSGLYLPLSGGTMTGTIAMGVNNITGTGTVTAGTFDVGGNVLITSPNSTTLQINNNLLPSATTTYNLGSVSKRWNNMYTNTLDTGTGVSIIVNGTITGDVQPTSQNGGRLGQSPLPWLSSEITTENTKNLKIWNSGRTFNTTITSANTSNTIIELPISNGGSNSILMNDGTGSTSWTTNYLPLSGGLMSGVIDMGNHKIIELIDPTDDQDAATKKYVDTQSGSYTQGLDFTWVLGSSVTLNSPTSITCLHTSDANGSSFRSYMFDGDTWSIECSLPDVSTLPLTNPADLDFFDNVFYIGTKATIAVDTGAGIICYNSTEGEGGIRFALINYHSGTISNSTAYEVGLLITIVYDGINVMYVNYKGYNFSLSLATFGFTLFKLFIGFDAIITATNIPITCDYVLWSYLGQYYMGGTAPSSTSMLVVNGKPLLTENGGTLIGNLHAPNIYSDKFIVNGGTNTQYLLADGTTANVSQIGSNIYFYKNNGSPIPAVGFLSFNNVVQASATIVYINNLTDDGVDISPFLHLIGAGNVLYIQDRNDSVNYINFTVITNTDVATGIQADVTFLNGAGDGLTNFGNNHPLYFSIFSSTSDVDDRLTVLETKTQNQTAVSGTTTFSGDVDVGTLSAGATTLSGTLTMGANTITSSGLLSAGTTILSGSLTMGSNAIISTGILSAGVTTLSGSLTMGSNAIISTGILSAGVTTLSGTLVMGSNAITSSGLLSAGSTTLSGNLVPTIASAGSLNIGSTSTLWNNVYTKSIPLYNTSSTFATTITSAATSSYPLILPTTQGADTNILMLSNGTGQTSWSGNYVPLSGNTGNPMTGNLTVGTNTFTAGASTVGTLSAGITTLTGNLLPTSSFSFLNIGSSGATWNNAYINTLNTGTGVAMNIGTNGTISGNIIPTSTNVYTLGTSSFGFQSIDTTTDNTTNLRIRNGANSHLITSASNSVNLPLVLPLAQGSTNNILMLSNGTTGQTSWSSNYVPLSGNTGNPMTGALTVGLNAFTAGATILNGSLSMGTNAIISSGSLSAGITTLSGTLTMGANTISSSGLLSAGATTLSGTLTMGANAITSTGTLAIGATTLSGNLVPTIASAGSLNIGSTSTLWNNVYTKSIPLYNASSTFATTITSAATSSYPLILPTNQGITNSVLTNDGIGNTSWMIPSIVSNNLINVPVAPLTIVKNTINYNNSLTTTIKTSDIIATLDNEPNTQQIFTFGRSVSNKWVAGSNLATNTISYSNDGINWTGLGATIFTSQCNGVAYNGSIWVAVGTGTTNTIAYSNDGINWTGLGTTIFITSGLAITWNGTIFMAGGTGPNCFAYSNDGINWTGIPQGITNFTTQCNGIAWNGSLWVAVGSGTNSLARSTDGITWLGTGTAAGNFNAGGFAIAWNGSLWVAGGGTTGSNTILWSIDGIAWTALGLTIFSLTCNGVAWNGTRWVAVGNGINGIAYSTDGKVWTGITLANSFSTGGLGISWSGGKFVAVGQASNSIMWSNDGVTWIGLGVPVFAVGRCIANNSIRENTIKFQPKLTIALGAGTNNIIYSQDNGINWTGVTGTTIFSTRGRSAVWNGKMWVAVGTGTNSIAYSYNGINWYGLGLSIFTGLSGCIGIVWSGTKWVACGQGTFSIAYSSDGITWTGATTTFTQVTGVAWNGKLFVAVGIATPSTNNIAYSSDGITWISATTSPFTTQCNGIAWGLNKWVVVGQTATPTISISYSYDGITWLNAATNAFTTAGRAVSYNGSLWVAVGQGTNTIAYSNDGITWTAATNVFGASNGFSVGWNGTRWIAGGNSGTVTLAISNDGITWANQTFTNLLGGCWGVSWNGNLGSAYIQQPTIVFGSGTISGSNTMAYSTDGINYNGLGKNIFSTQGNSGAWNGTIWVAGGSGTNTLAYSSDGINWIGLGSPIITTSVNAVAWNGTIWVAVGSGTNSIAYSSDGKIWTAASTNPFTQGNGIAWNGTTWVAVGQGGTNTIYYSTNANVWNTAANNPFTASFGLCVIWNGVRFLAGGNLGTNTLAYSTDGITWTNFGVAVTNSVTGLAFNGTRCVAVGGAAPAYSNDGGLTWTVSASIPFSLGGLGVAWNGKIFVAAGQGGNTIAISGDGIKWTGLAANNTIITTTGFGVAVNNPVYGLDSSIILQPSINRNNNKIDVITSAYNNSGWGDFSCNIISKSV